MWNDIFELRRRKSCSVLKFNSLWNVSSSTCKLYPSNIFMVYVRGNFPELHKSLQLCFISCCTWRQREINSSALRECDHTSLTFCTSSPAWLMRTTLHHPGKRGIFFSLYLFSVNKRTLHHILSQCCSRETDSLRAPFICFLSPLGLFFCPTLFVYESLSSQFTDRTDSFLFFLFFHAD